MEFRLGEDAFFYFPVIDEQTNTPIIITDAVAVWTCGQTVNNEWTPALTYHTADPGNPIIATSDPDDMSENPPENTFRVLIPHDDSAKLLGTYDYEIAMMLGDYRIIIYPPIDEQAQFTVLPSKTWDPETGKSRIARLPSLITSPAIQIEKIPAKPTRKIEG